MLIGFSFFYTEKTTNMVLELDTIMIKIKEEAKSYSKESINAVISDNTIIPGISAKEVNINKSYKQMKEHGFYSSKYLVYDYKKPVISINDNKNKYIIKGNETKKMVSLIFIVQGNTKIDNILNILNSNNIKGNFFVDNIWLKNNIETAYLLIKEGHELGNLSINMDYSNSAFLWINSIIKKVLKQENNYCLKTNKISDLEICSMNDLYTISPLYIEKNPFINTKKELTKGLLIAYKLTNTLEKELNLIIKYIIAKDIAITTLSNHLME